MEERLNIETSGEKKNDFKGESHAFEAVPKVVFVEYDTLDRTYKRHVKLVNRSRKPQRLHLVTPKCSNWQVSYVKSGMIAVGMHEDVLIEFKPRKLKIYQQEFTVLSETDSFVVQMIANPVGDESHMITTVKDMKSRPRTSTINNIEGIVTKLPNRIDFGTCSLNSETLKRIRFGMNLPIDYKFRIEIRKQNMNFMIEPMSGIIPAKGSIDIHVTFKPISLHTSFMEFHLVVEKEYSPVQSCSVVGSVTEFDSSQLTNSVIQQNLDLTIRTRRDLRIHDELVGVKRKKELKKHLDALDEPTTVQTTHRFRSGSAGSLTSSRTKISHLGLRSKKWGTTLNEEQQRKIRDRRDKESDLKLSAARYSEDQKRKETKWQESLGETPLTQEYMNELISEREGQISRDFLLKREVARERKITEANPNDKVLIDVGQRKEMLNQMLSKDLIFQIDSPSVMDIGPAMSLTHEGSTTKEPEKEAINWTALIKQVSDKVSPFAEIPIRKRIWGSHRDKFSMDLWNSSQ